MNHETFRQVMKQIDLFNYTVEQLKTGIQLAHELELSGRIEPHDARSHISDFVKSAHVKIDEIGVMCQLALSYQDTTK